MPVRSKGVREGGVRLLKAKPRARCMKSSISKSEFIRQPERELRSANKRGAAMLEEESMAIAPPRMLRKAMAAPAGAPMAMPPPAIPNALEGSPP